MEYKCGIGDGTQYSLGLFNLPYWNINYDYEVVQNRERLLFNLPYWNINDVLLDDKYKIEVLFNLPYWNINEFDFAEKAKVIVLFNLPYWNINSSTSCSIFPDTTFLIYHIGI